MFFESCTPRRNRDTEHMGFILEKQTQDKSTIYVIKRHSGLFLLGMELQNTWDFFLEIGSNILDFLYSKVAKANY